MHDTTPTHSTEWLAPAGETTTAASAASTHSTVWLAPAGETTTAAPTHGTVWSAPAGDTTTTAMGHSSGAAREAEASAAPAGPLLTAAVDEAAAGSGGDILILYAFSGHAGRPDGFEHFVEACGALCCMIDAEIDPVAHDLSDERVRHDLMRNISELKFRGSLWSPPCGTFSAARSISRGPFGPVPPTSATGPGRYGLPRLSPQNKDEVRLGTLLAVSTIAALK
eukprot:1022179-Heterocapsa_arctica.AAC.1